MRTNRILLALAVVIFAGGSFSTARAAEQALKAEDAIAQVLSDYGTAWNNGDVRGIAELFTLDADDALIGSVARGRAEIEKRYTQLVTQTFRGSQMALAMSALRFVNPAAAMVDGSFELNGVPDSGASQTQVKRLFIAIIVNEGDRWRVTAFWSAPPSRTDSTQ
jgi:uncharacterized protein (TIGR02246 family)